MAVCECCPNTGKMNLFEDMLMCDECIAKEKKAIAEKPVVVIPQRESIEEFQAKIRAARDANIASGAIQPDPTIDPMPKGSGILNINNLVDKAREVTNTITSRPEVFNAHTVALHEVYAAMDADVAVINKQFAKSEYTAEHIKSLQKVIFDANQTIIDANNKIRASQGELNKLVLTLREEERQKLGIVTPDYKPQGPKTPKAAAKPRAKKAPKLDKKELMDVAAELQKEGLPVQWSMLHTICVARDMTPKQAADVARKQLGGA
jgi:hypothetical protein